MWLSDLRLVLRDQIIEKGSIRLAEGKIAEIKEGPVANAYVHAPGMTAIPGLVDVHGDMLEQEVQPRPNANIPVDIALHELDKRFVGSGVTTAFSAIAFSWESKTSIRSEEKARGLIETINRLRPTLLADHYVHSRFEITNPEAGTILQGLLENKQVHLVSLMDHTPGQGQFRDIERFIKFAVEWQRSKGESTTEDEMRAHVKDRQSWPKAWDIVREIAKFCAEHNITLASHDDDTVEKVALLSDYGIKISEFPVTAEAAAEARRRHIHVAMGAPNAMRGGSLSGNLSAAEAVGDGLVDTLASDYYPPAMLQAAYTLVRQGILDLPAAIRLITANPADGVGFKDRGVLEVGKTADIAIIDDRDLPRVHGTFRRGEPVYWDRFMSELSGHSQHLVAAQSH